MRELYRWRDTLALLPEPPTLESIAILVGDEDLQTRLLELQDAASRSTDIAWNPAEISRRLDAARKLTRDRRRVTSAVTLSPLNPAKSLS